MEFKDKFLARYEKLTDIEKFKEYSLKEERKSIRVNTLKTNIPRIKKVFDLKQIPWIKEGFWIKGKQIGNTLEHFLGYIYIQEAASMIPPLVLNPNQDDIVLDMCASPGSKTTELAAIMQNNGLIIANDVAYKRTQPLTINLQRCGVLNTLITLRHGRFFNQKFDKILVDAPCSGTGTIRKSLKTINMWNPNTIKKLAGTQKQLLYTAFECLKNKGTLVYSTCSLEPDENEAVVDALLKRYHNAKLESIKLKINRSPAVLNFENKEFNPEVEKCLRIWPQDNDTDGFFVAKISKK